MLMCVLESISWHAGKWSVSDKWSGPLGPLASLINGPGKTYPGMVHFAQKGGVWPGGALEGGGGGTKLLPTLCNTSGVACSPGKRLPALDWSSA